MIEELNKKIETLTKDKEKLQSENKELKTQVESLLLDKASVVFSWIANKTNTYKIKLNEGEILQIKR
jgi:cell division septum initiation protein DivIVA